MNIALHTKYVLSIFCLGLVVYKDVFFFFWVAQNLTSSIPKNHIFQHSGSKNNPRIQKFPRNWLLLYFTLCGWFQLKIMSRSRVMNHFRLCSKTAHFDDLEHKNLNILGWLKFVKNLQAAIFFKEWAFSEQLILLKNLYVFYQHCY